MRTSLASALSVAGVVAAGAAAFALNTAVLTTGATDTGTIAPTTLPTATETGFLTPAGPTGGGATAAGGGTAIRTDSPTPNTITPQSTQVAATLTTYTVGPAGSVVIDSAGGALSVKNIVPASGWTSEPAWTDSSGVVHVHFVNGSSRLEFVARVENGSVTVEVKNESVSPPVTALPPTITKPSQKVNNRDHESEDHENEDHDNEDHKEWHDDDDD